MQCASCKGSGQVPKATPTETQAGGSMLTCGLCRGSGTERHVLAIVEWSHDIHNQSCDNHIPMVWITVFLFRTQCSCSTCKGKGQMACEMCSGAGRVKTFKELTVSW